MNEPDEQEPSGPELPIRVTVPEEFAGFAMGEVNAHRGSISGIEVQQGGVVIQASLPPAEYENLAREVASATQRRGKVERIGP